MMSKMFCLWFTLFSVLFNAQHLVVAIDLARLYGHDGHESSIQKRSGNYKHLNSIILMICFSPIE